ncbi:hypothetical protein [Pseudorhizobium flavum]|uniref:Putative ion transporter superfamily protein YfcC n=1 Tax=Pseudorhizobium flavum TaxID=1335061 RepID=A0A7W9Z3E7_9HYPH|nr:hypothetical protein [Pseudorhizobium flavum]MBB6182446.1 putative ion transporter superfamily protein YfcC [Pseudorhizobium flavum]CAD6631573.1 hypothetical protein RFYW14_04542 [Pseudorhizobium flavum]
MPDSLYSLIISGVVSVLVLWLVFFVVRKLIGAALLVALAMGIWMVWNDPGLLQQWLDAVKEVFDSYV